MINMGNKITINQYLSDIKEKSFIYKYGERILLAHEFIDTINQQLKYSQLMNLDNLYIEKIDAPDVTNIYDRFKIDYSESSKIEDNNLFENFDFGSPNIFGKLKGLGKKTFYQNYVADVKKYYKEEDVIYSISIFLFNICFCIHPLKGRNYYKNTITSTSEIIGFYSNKPKFIFDLEKNKNRFINGYHSAEWQLWKNSFDFQQTFWNDAFSGKFKTIKDLSYAWHSAYDFECSESKTACRSYVPTLIFKDEKILITSDRRIGVKDIPCRNCLRSLDDKCKICRIERDKQLIQFPQQTVKILCKIKNDSPTSATDVIIKKEIDFVLYDGKIICEKDINVLGGDREVLSIKYSKKADILGVFNLLDEPIIATQGKIVKEFNKGQPIILLPGVQLTILGEFTLTVPGEATNKEAPKDAPKKEMENVEEEIKVENQVDENIPNDSILKTQCKVLNESDTYSLERNSCLLYLNNKIRRFPIVKDNCDNDEDKQRYLWVLEPSVFNRVGFKKNIEDVVNLKLNYSNILTPVRLVEPKGIASEKFGYITRRYGNSLQKISMLFKEDKSSMFKTRDILLAFYDIFEKLDEIHNMGFSIKTFGDESFAFTKDKNDVYNIVFRLVHNMSLDAKDISGYTEEEYSEEYMPFLVKGKFLKPNKISDCYAISVLLFKAIFKVEKFEIDKFKADSTGIKGMIINLFNSQDDNPYASWEKKCLSKMAINCFKATFIDIPSLKKMEDNLTIQLNIELYKKQPTAKQWCGALKEWINLLN